MAGDWLKWTKGLSRKREVAIIAAALKVDRFSVAARLMEFWEWCDENVQEKDVSNTGSAVINLSQEKCDNIALIDSIVGLQGFAVAMSDAGWLAIRTSSIEVPNFVRHNGETAKTRAKNALRQQTHRKQGVTKVSQKKCDKTVTREEKRREEKKKDLGEVSPKPPLADATEGEQNAEPPKRKREPNPYWDVICSVFGFNPKTDKDKTRVGSLARDLKLKIDDPQKTEAEIKAEVEVRIARHRRHWPNVAIVTPDSILKNWDTFAKEPASAKQSSAPSLRYDPTRDGQSDGDYLAFGEVVQDDPGAA